MKRIPGVAGVPFCRFQSFHMCVLASATILAKSLIAMRLAANPGHTSNCNTTGYLALHVLAAPLSFKDGLFLRGVSCSPEPEQLTNEANVVEDSSQHDL